MKRSVLLDRALVESADSPGDVFADSLRSAWQRITNGGYVVRAGRWFPDNMGSVTAIRVEFDVEKKA